MNKKRTSKHRGVKLFVIAALLSLVWIMKFLRDNLNYILPSALFFGVTSFILLRKYFKSSAFLDITKNYTQERKFGQKESPGMNGLKLKFFTRLLNSRIGQSFIGPMIVKNAHFDMLRNIVINEKPTFYPVKILPNIDYAKSGEKVDNIPLKNRFKKNEWRPRVIDDYVSAYLSLSVTPVEIAQDIINKVKAVNSEMHIFCDFDETLILAQAEESKKRYASGKAKGPLDGVPIAIKDQIDIIGHTVRNGLEHPEERKSTFDAEVIRRIRNEGMIIIGLVNMHQVGIATIGTNNSKFHGDCINPVNPDFYPGGSSSGSAAVVASGLVPCAIGSDGGGSCRIPASFCGMSAIKPTAGRISHRGYISGTNSALGPMCNTMVDCAKLYSVLAGPDFENQIEKTWFQPKIQIPKCIPEKLNFNIGVDQTWLKEIRSNAIYRNFTEKLEILVAKGCKVHDIAIYDLDYYHISHMACFMQELLARAREYMSTGKHMASDYFGAMAIQNGSVLGCDYVIANKIRTKMMKQVEKIFEKVDFIATPTTATGTVRVDANDYQFGRMDVWNCLGHTEFCKLANFTGIPGISTPMGLDENKMPVGFHLMAKWWNEFDLIQASTVLEAENSYTRPQYYLANKYV